jgi:hypothetical protein
MGTAVRTTRLSQALRLLPRPLLAVLDGWSLRIAQRRAQRRRLAAMLRQQAAVQQ